MPFGIDANGNPTPGNDNSRGGANPPDTMIIKSGQCPQGYTWDYNSGQCIPQYQTANPQGNQQPKSNPPNQGNCPGGQMMDPAGSGRCVPGAPTNDPGNCPPDQMWNGYQCIPKTTAGTATEPCPDGQQKVNGQCPPPKAGAGGTGGTFTWTGYNSPRDAFLAALNSGLSGEAAVQQANSAFNLPYGGGFAYYPDKDVYATPGGGYFAKGPDGKWGWNQGDSRGGGGGNVTIDSTSPLQRFLSGPLPSQTSPPPPAFTPTPYTPGAGNFPTYTPAQFAPIPNYQPSALRPTTEALIQQMLSTTSMSPEVVAKMKESQKDTLVSAADQMKQAVQQNAASRGAYGSVPNNLSAIDMSTLGNLSGAYRGIETQKALQDRIDQMSAISTSDDYQKQLLDEFLQTQGLKLTGEEAQAAEGYKGYQSQQTATQDYLAQQQIQFEAAQANIARWLQAQGIDLSFLGLGENARQFDASNALNLGRFLAGR